MHRHFAGRQAGRHQEGQRHTKRRAVVHRGSHPQPATPTAAAGERLGYHSSWVVLNARDIGIDPALGPVPQNRDRLFMLSWRDDLGLPDQFPWPQPQTLTRTIADVLDEDVAENFFLKPESVISFLTRNEQGDRCLYRVSDHLPTPDEVRQWVRETTDLTD